MVVAKGETWAGPRIAQGMTSGYCRLCIIKVKILGIPGVSRATNPIGVRDIRAPRVYSVSIGGHLDMAVDCEQEGFA